MLVYEVWNLLTDEPFYVGKCKDISIRKKEHLSDMKKRRYNSFFHNTLRKLIEENNTYEFREVFFSDNEQDVFAEEIRLIKLYGRKDLGLGPLTNLTAGGEGKAGWKPNKKTKELWSKLRKGMIPSNKGKTYKHKVVSPKKGKAWSEKQKEWYDNRTQEEIEQKSLRSSQSHKGQQQSEEWCAEHSKRMSGSNNPNFGKVGYYSGKVGPNKGKPSPIKGRKKGPDGKLYHPKDLLEKFSIYV